MHVTDNVNNVNFTSRLPPNILISEVLGEDVTCEQIQDVVNTNGFSVQFSIIFGRGQFAGIALAAVTASGTVPECGNFGQAFFLVAAADETILPGGSYNITGCLDKGKINFSS